MLRAILIEQNSLSRVENKATDLKLGPLYKIVVKSYKLQCKPRLNDEKRFSWNGNNTEEGNKHREACCIDVHTRARVVRAIWGLKMSYWWKNGKGLWSPYQHYDTPTQFRRIILWFNILFYASLRYTLKWYAGIYIYIKYNRRGKGIKLKSNLNE